MTYEPITRLEIENFGCIKNATFHLSPLHALIGPNDSGKTTALKAMEWACQFRNGRPNRLFANGVVRIGWADGLIQGLSGVGEPPWRHDAVVPIGTLTDRIAEPTYIRFDPDFLRMPSPLIVDGGSIVFADDRGRGLAGVFDALFNRDFDVFTDVQSSVKALFPSIGKLQLTNVDSSTKAIAVTLTDGTRVEAKAMSEGLLYYLGFLALTYVGGSRLFLVEEPENGLHPARISKVMDILREISKTSQVILATHSPLVINELQGDEVSVVTRDPEKGTQTILLKDVPRFAKASKVYQPGEFWLNYADGDLEAPLFENGKSRS